MNPPLVQRLERIVRKLARRRARRYARAGLGVENFFRELQARGVRYAALRWWESLPVVAPGEDVDLLIDDDDLARIEDLFVPWRGGLACDVYTAGGLPGSDFQKMAYYPPHLAAGLLERAVLKDGLYRVPAPADHFASLAYHALYHKGYASGLRSAHTPIEAPKKLPDHDYAQALARLAAAVGTTVAIDLESLDAHLGTIGWRPPLDMLARLSLRNPWIREHVFRDGFEVEPAKRGVAVYLVRERAAALGLSARASEQLAAQGFTIVATFDLTDEFHAAAVKRLRGGNWGRGPWPLSGGVPVRLIVVWDGRPTAVDAVQKKEYPLLDNARILAAKESLREAWMAGVPKRERFNPLHSSDNDAQAWEYMEILLQPAPLSEVEQRIAALNQAR